MSVARPLGKAQYYSTTNSQNQQFVPLSSVAYRSIERRQIVALAVDDVIHGCCDVFFGPEVSRASVPRPNTARLRDQPIAFEFSSCVGFKSVHHRLRFLNCGIRYMYMVCSYVERKKTRIFVIANFANGFFDGDPCLSIQYECGMFHQASVTLDTETAWRDLWIAESVILASIHRSAFVTVKPRSVCSDRDQVSQRL